MRVSALDTAQPLSGQPLSGQPLSGAQLGMLRAMLEQLRRFRLDQLDQLRRTTVRPRPPTEADREVDRSLVSAAQAALSDILHALRRIEDGSYGRCLHCSCPLPLDRLEVLPQAALCMPCQRVQDALRTP